MKPSNPGSPRAFHTLLRQRSLSFACAESCTGGLLAQQTTALAGSSEVFWGGVVTYSNQAKMACLGVPASLLETVGAVSGEVARAMVEGLVARSGVPIAVSVTGIAGPTGGVPEKPVGTVWFGLAASRNQHTVTVAVRCQFGGTRAQIQRQAATAARILSWTWWDSAMELDSLRSLTDNEENALIKAILPSRTFPPTSL